MPPKTPGRSNQRQARPRGGSDPTVSIASASAAKTSFNTNEEPRQQAEEQSPKQETNDDLKKLIETLKNKMGIANNTPPQKKAPPVPKAKGIWDRSINKESTTWNPKPAYTVLTRISNHEKVPIKSVKQPDITINSVPHSFLYKPGVDGITVDKLTIKAGKQVGIG